MQRIAYQVLDGRRGTSKRDVGAIAESVQLGLGDRGILDRAFSPVKRRIEFVRDVVESGQLGLGDRVDSRLQFPEGVHHFVLSSTQKHRPDAVGHGEAVFQLEALASLNLFQLCFPELPFGP